MWKYVNNSTKVFIDKVIDYILYYTKYSDDVILENLLNNNILVNTLQYENENTCSRIYPSIGLYNDYITFWNNPTYIIDNIYLGSAFNAADYITLKKYNIKIIMNVTKEISNYYPNDFIYYRYKLYDNNKHSIKPYLEQSLKDINYCQQNIQGNILIHCFMGASRSASIVLYYLMKTMKHQNNIPYNFDDSIKFLKSKRKIINPTFRLTKDLVSI